MRSLEDVLARLQSLEAEEPGAIVEALGRVEDGRRKGAAGAEPLHRLMKELGRDADPAADTDTAPPGAEDDPFPGLGGAVAVSGTVPGTEPVPAGGVPREVVTRALLDTLESYQSLLERHRRDFDEVFERRALGEDDPEDEAVRRLRAAQSALLKYPIAAQAAFAAMVREGRRYAETEEGEQWRRRLAGSAMLGKARTMFEGLSSGMLAEDGAALPSTYVDGFLQALDRNLEEVLGELGRAPKPE